MKIMFILLFFGVHMAPSNNAVEEVADCSSFAYHVAEAAEAIAPAFVDGDGSAGSLGYENYQAVQGAAMSFCCSMSPNGSGC